MKFLLPLNFSIVRKLVLFAATALSLSLSVEADVKMPRILSDGMVVQRETPTEIWGWANPGEAVEVRFRGASERTVAGADGSWSVELPSNEAGGPWQMAIEGDNLIVFKNIYAGDVWICSGQSNMQLWMERVKERYPEEIANSENPEIRWFGVNAAYDFKEPKEDLASGNWSGADPESVLNFSAVGYFFAREINKKYGIPIGLIGVAVGGSPIESWMSEDILSHYPKDLEEAIRFRDAALIEKIEKENQRVSGDWYGALDGSDKGLIDGNRWSDFSVDENGWSPIELPGFWDEQGIEPMNGAVWFRKEIDLSDSDAGKPANLYLGTIVDADTTYINGVKVGNTTYQYPPRRYTVSEGVLRAGKNVITVRAVSNSGRGSFTKDKPFDLVLENRKIDLRGTWKYRIGAKMDPIGPTTFIRWKPLGMYNAMIAPLHRNAIKGVLWYQGESNLSRPSKYKDQLELMIDDWRSKWGQGDFPFLFAQLPGLGTPQTVPAENSSWAELREQQRKTLSAQNTGMAICIDLGEWNDIHPLNKEDVGKRFALLARSIAYGESGFVSSGPLFRSASKVGNRVRIEFGSTGSGLIAKGDGILRQFAIAGSDGKFVWAKARIEDESVVVWSDEIKAPQTVRYAWADNPEGANLYNTDGLPASPFEAIVE